MKNKNFLWGLFLWHIVFWIFIVTGMANWPSSHSNTKTKLQQYQDFVGAIVGGVIGGGLTFGGVLWTIRYQRRQDDLKLIALQQAATDKYIEYFQDFSEEIDFIFKEITRMIDDYNKINFEEESENNEIIRKYLHGQHRNVGTVRLRIQNAELERPKAVQFDRVKLIGILDEMVEMAESHVAWIEPETARQYLDIFWENLEECHSILSKIRDRLEIKRRAAQEYGVSP